ncbi:PTS beta-glucoside transporter subunit EIIBCA [Lelliottia sp. F153]|uniref:beta-glucoside-specific PTS transporter subunit IIABC n=1 Tax=unclassified Lelliottia TaxID=2642424 RepID=UPI000C7F26DD|nr:MULTISPECIES: beta-glucoside-specific PTS transporter subunit IIABC [unclassified Lelliottia]PLY43059.1 PTS beta-glucoside transporter subunit EIIBCA [Lelliottia sp. F159]PLY48796.1 PTS beta-glucoside transporter subunit EIIBCA [Lelliottia sp. F154]PLY53123.1 PTS beta-glucoside transporter subunit EIIBCA [Lelliottia sp. F153]
MNHLQTALDIIAQVGGAENIEHLEHCSTRLRLSLYDNGKVNERELAKIDGVLGVRVNVQCQVIIGHEVVQVYEAARSLIGTPQANASAQTVKPHRGAQIVDFVISVFQPLVPAIAGGGVLKSLLLLLDVLGWLSRDSSTYKVLDNIGSAPLYFLPILVAITTATKLKVNVLVAVSAVAVMVLPAMTKQLADGAEFMSFDLRNVAYASQVFPAILCVLFYAQTEKLFNRYSPGALRIFLSPMLSLLVTVPVTLLILGPLGYELGAGLATVILWLYGKLGFVATGLLAAALPFMVAAGMHKPMLPYAVASMSQFGREMLYLPASLAHNIAESGACLAIALRSKDKVLKSTAFSAGISALFGITEPALYGVTLLNKKALYSVLAGSLVGGAFIGWMAIEAFALVGPGLASISMFVSPDNPMNIVWAFAGAGLSFVIAFLSALLLWRDKAPQQADELHFIRPVEGQIIPLENVNDDVFSRKIMGDGVAIVPSQGVLRAPADGTVVNVFESGHALSLLTDAGVELIFHIGIDTIRLQGDGFRPLVKEGQHVKSGDTLIEFSLDTITAAGLDPVVVMIVTNGERFSLTPGSNHDKDTHPHIIMTLKESV